MNEAAEASMDLLVIAERRNAASDQRIKRLEGAIQAMAAAIRPLRKQGEDHIWRPAQVALSIADDAILDRFDPAAVRLALKAIEQMDGGL